MIIVGLVCMLVCLGCCFVYGLGLIAFDCLGLVYVTVLNV